ncbi:MAG TPA: histidinol dehydrogenase, partial [Phenylobacterium sp.]|nr:histidinol dehydrogenase [Phenylobacterium sp.]
MRRFTFTDPDFDRAFRAFVAERRETPPAIEDAVREVLAAVRERGLEAVLEFGRKFDRANVDAANIRVSAEEIAD